MWPWGQTVALAAGGELQLVDLKDPRRPRLLSALPGQLARLVGRDALLYGLSEQGLEVFTVEEGLEHRGSLQVEQARDLAPGDQTLVYVLLRGALFVIDAGDVQPVVLSRLDLDTSAARLTVVRSILAILEAESVTTFSLARPWLPRRLSSMDVQGVKDIARWGTHLSTRGPRGTQLLQLTPDGKLVRVADYPGGHWADALLASDGPRHLLACCPMPAASRSCRSSAASCVISSHGPNSDGARQRCHVTPATVSCLPRQRQSP